MITQTDHPTSTHHTISTNVCALCSCPQPPRPHAQHLHNRFQPPTNHQPTNCPNRRDQPNFSDAALSTVVGFPIFSVAWAFQGGKHDFDWLRQHKELVDQFVYKETTHVSGYISQVAK